MNTSTVDILESEMIDSKRRSLMSQIIGYVQLTKPRIVLLFGLTGVATLVMERSLLSNPFHFWMVFLGIILTAGSANALNQYIDRDIDAIMDRTRKKRPIPNGTLTPSQALVFSIITGTVAIILLASFGSLLAAFWGVFTIAFYIGIYTLWLKRTTPYNIVIGGAAGATAPLIAWAAATGEVSLGAFISFLIIFMWTPPHFWALALCVKDEYAKVSVPMLPVVKGVSATKRQIFWYSIFLVPLSLGLVWTKNCGWFYGVAAVILGAEFLRRAYMVLKSDDVKVYWKMFGYSIVYLLVLYIAIIGDAFAKSELPSEAAGVGITEKLGAQVDTSLTFKNENDETVALSSVLHKNLPVVLLLAYYRCPNLCGLFLNGTRDSLNNLYEQVKYTVGREFEVVTISIDTTETPALATLKKNGYIKSLTETHPEIEGSLNRGWHFWVNDLKLSADHAEHVPSGTARSSMNSHVRTLADQVGFGYKYDPKDNQYAHAATMLVLTPEGKISRYLYGIEFRPKDLKLAILEASGGKIGTVMDRFMLFCYNYDPKAKKYSLYAVNIMKAGGGLTVLVLAASFVALFRRGRKVEEKKHHVV